MGRVLFVVARSAVERYEYLRYAFAGDECVEVVLDRRRGERRRGAAPPTAERRRGERRVRDLSSDLERIGWVVVRR